MLIVFPLLFSWPERAVNGKANNTAIEDKKTVEYTDMLI